jgi:PAS domain S-box-containing protein
MAFAGRRRSIIDPSTMADDRASLLAIAHIVGETTELTEALRLICREVTRLTGAETGAAYLLDPAASELRPVAAYHVPHEMLTVLGTTPLPLAEQGFAGTVFEAGRVVWSDDVGADPRFGFRLFRLFVHQSGVVIPLSLDGTVTGAFYLVWWKLRRQFAESEIAVLEAIGQQVAVLLRNAQLLRQAEERRLLAEACEERFRALAGHAPVGILMAGPDGHGQYVNDRWCRMAGLGAERAAGLGWLEAVHPDDRERLLAEWRVASEAGRELSLEFRFLSPHGVVTVVSGQAVVLREAGALVGYLGTVTDITERKRAEDALRASEERYRQLFDRNLAAMFRTRPSGEFLVCNDAFARLVGCASPDEVRAHQAAELYESPTDRERMVARLSAGEAITGTPLRWRRLDGMPLSVLVSVREVVDGATRYFEGTALDVTDQQRAAEAERQAEELLAVARLASAAAHEINNPLAVIMAHLQMLAREVDGPGLDRIEKMMATCGRIRDIVIGMRRITRLEQAPVSPGQPNMLDIRKSSAEAGESRAR